ncbi:hypothetical protein [Zooshikella sp. RANM57]|uniref:hypothetical protein n=1 Tax=Zooshikella sp. RANM57 TaxID=3425863 RepID=UPI003D6ECD4E
MNLITKSAFTFLLFISCIIYASPSDDEFDNALSSLGAFQSSQARQAIQILLQADQSTLKKIHKALAEVSAEENKISDYQSEAFYKIAAKKIQLVMVLGLIGDQKSIKPLIDADKISLPEHMVHQQIFSSLAQIGPSEEIYLYAKKVLNTEGVSIIHQRSAFVPLIMNLNPELSSIVTKYLANNTSTDIKDMAIFLGAKLGLKDLIMPHIKSWLAKPLRDVGDYYVLLALAEIVSPDEFVKSVKYKALSQNFVSLAKKYNDFKYAKTKDDKNNQVSVLLSSSAFELRLLALEYLLKNKRLDLLERNQVVTKDQNNNWTVPYKYAAEMRMLGYKIKSNGDIATI